MLLLIIIGLVWMLLMLDAYLVTHRKRVFKPTPIDLDEEHNLLYGRTTEATTDDSVFTLPEEG